MKKNYAPPELELQENPDVITTSAEVVDNDPEVETPKMFFRFS